MTSENYYFFTLNSSSWNTYTVQTTLKLYTDGFLRIIPRSQKMNKQKLKTCKQTYHSFCLASYKILNKQQCTYLFYLVTLQITLHKCKQLSQHSDVFRWSSLYSIRLSAVHFPTHHLLLHLLTRTSCSAATTLLLAATTRTISPTP